jgi:hypothetical protein
MGHLRVKITKEVIEFIDSCKFSETQQNLNVNILLGYNAMRFLHELTFRKNI